MNSKDDFKRVSIEEMKTKKLVNDALKELDNQINIQCELLADKLINENGFEPDSFEIHTQNTITGNDLKVEFLVVTKMKELSFKLVGGE